MQQYKINMTINFIETSLSFGNVLVKTGSTSDGDCRLEFGFDIPENPSSKLKKRIDEFSEEVLRGDATISIGNTTIDFEYVESKVTFITKNKRIVLRHTLAPECLRESLSDMLWEEESEESEKEEEIQSEKTKKDIQKTARIPAKKIGIKK
jgi:hypothetical protein